MLTDFQNSFTIILYSKFAVKESINILPQFTHVAIPCKTFVLKNRKLHCPGEKVPLVLFIYFRQLCIWFRNFLACSIAMDQSCRWVIKYFSCLLGNAVLTVEWSTWITQSSQQRFVSGVVVCQLVCRLAVDSLNIIFTALHGMQTRSSDDNSVCPSVRPSVCTFVCQMRA